MAGSNVVKGMWRNGHDLINWQTIMQNCRLPSVYELEQKEVDIKKAINHSYKEDELSVVDLLAKTV
jgi:hypothetical protein